MSVTVNLKGLERQIKNLTRLNMKNIGLKAKELNFDQITKKKNKDGSKFKPYTEAYAKRKGVGVNQVDLTSKAKGLSEEQKKKPYATMLKNYHILKLKRYSVILGFTSNWDQQKASWVVSGGKSNDRARPFVGLNKMNRRRLNKFAYKLITRGTY